MPSCAAAAEQRACTSQPVPGSTTVSDIQPLANTPAATVSGRRRRQQQCARLVLVPEGAVLLEHGLVCGSADGAARALRGHRPVGPRNSCAPRTAEDETVCHQRAAGPLDCSGVGGLKQRVERTEQKKKLTGNSPAARSRPSAGLRLLVSSSMPHTTPSCVRPMAEEEEEAPAPPSTLLLLPPGAAF